jgi:hypothetical protein
VSAHRTSSGTFPTGTEEAIREYIEGQELVLASRVESCIFWLAFLPCFFAGLRRAPTIP